jgi:acyl dehydratase
MGFDMGRIGEWTEVTELKVEAERTVAYAEATNDTHPLHTSGELAPPLFAVVPIYPVMSACVAMVTPPDKMLGGVHGEQDMRFHRPIEPGMLLRARGKVTGVHAKASGTTVSMYATVEDGDGTLLNEQHMTAFLRGVNEGESAGEPAPGRPVVDPEALGAPSASVVQHFDDDQTFRYADASGDRVPIHLDADLAKKLGFPGIIGHGLCTMAMSSVAAVQTCCDGDPRLLARLAVRFAKPVIPGDDITTSFWRSDGGWLFETRNPAGDRIIANGLADAR